jgi:hypothetical protein
MTYYHIKILKINFLDSSTSLVAWNGGRRRKFRSYLCHMLATLIKKYKIRMSLRHCIRLRDNWSTALNVMADRHKAGAYSHTEKKHTCNYNVNSRACLNNTDYTRRLIVGVGSHVSESTI